MEQLHSSHTSSASEYLAEQRDEQISTVPVQGTDRQPRRPTVIRNPQSQPTEYMSMYSSGESNPSFSSNCFSSDQLLASALYGSRSESPVERPSNPPPPHESTKMSTSESRNLQPAVFLNDRSGTLVSRQRSLTRPERQRPRPGMVSGMTNTITMDQLSSAVAASQTQNTDRENKHIGAITSNSGIIRIPLGAMDHAEAMPKRQGFSFARFSWWVILSRLATCCFPGCCLRIWLKKNSKMVQQAWREKVTLVYIILFCCGAMAFLTFGLKYTICSDLETDSYAFYNETTKTRERVFRDAVVVHGRIYPFSVMQGFLQTQNISMSADYKNLDLTALFDTDVTGACAKYDAGLGYGRSTLGNCIVPGPYGGTLQKGDSNCIPFRTLHQYYKSKRALVYDWSDLQPNGPAMNVANPVNLTVLGDGILNLDYYVASGQRYFGDRADVVIRQARGQDASYMFSYWDEVKQAEACLNARYYSGVISSDTMGCIISQLITSLMFAIIIGLIVVRFSMAAVFHWFVAPKLVKPGGRSGKILAWRSVAGGNNDPAIRRPPIMAPEAESDTSPPPMSVPVKVERSFSTSSENTTMFDAGSVDTQLYTLMLVTCYSEGEASMRRSLDSLARTTYSNRHKVFFIVADGMITGSGNTRTTPDILLSMLTLCSGMEEPKRCTYMAIAEGGKQLNIAKVYAGHYMCDDQMYPAILIVKCGTVDEQGSSKPGNRGKRDSQLILMSFLQRVLFNDRMSVLDYEIFWKITWLMKGITPEKFELVLMIDADTMVEPESLSHMVAAMVNDITVMGLCGETRIANKTDSWVTMIQVFEYYISHHYAKAFESVFGGVTCLPGCFCMYRVKAPKNGAWVPLLANPDIVLEYNQNVVTTLHAKNLLFLGEDRFLSTLMLRTFPKRQMMFLPQAVCKTVVPDTFHVLLSQRRRWINSTIHNLMELVLVSDLCGIACLSMQFVVFMDLLGTAILPAAVILAVYVIVVCAMSSQPPILPIAVLVAILGLPAILIVVTTRKISMFGWLLIYIVALPVWNFLLPVYAFWHFDDFTWGATRRVHGDKANEGHTENDGDFDSSQVIMRKWEEWEALRWGRRKGPIRMTLITPSNASTMDESKRATPVSPLSPTFLDRQKFGSSSTVASVRTSNEKDRRRRSVPVYMTPSLNRSREFRTPNSPPPQDFQSYRMSSDFTTAKQGAMKSEGYFGPQSAVSLAPQTQDAESSSVTVGSLSIYSRRLSEATNATGLGSEGASNENDHYPAEEWTSDVASTLQQVLQQHR